MRMLHILLAGLIVLGATACTTTYTEGELRAGEAKRDAQEAAEGKRDVQIGEEGGQNLELIREDNEWGVDREDH